MKMEFLLLIVLVFASDENTKSGKRNEEQVVVKIEEDECAKKAANYFGVGYNRHRATWGAQRWSKEDKKYFYNGTYKDEKTAAQASDTLAKTLIANGEKGHKLNFSNDNTEVYPTKKEPMWNYFGVVCNLNKHRATWSALRWSKKKNKYIYNGTYKDEETAALASDEVARKLLANGEKDHKINFPDDDTTNYQQTKASNFIGVCYHKQRGKWVAQRRGKNGKKTSNNGCYQDEETAAHASDTLARELIANGEKGHKLNFPDDNIEVYPEKASDYIGVTYNKNHQKWGAARHSKHDNKVIFNGASYENEDKAAHASDTLAKKLIANGEKGHELNFPGDDTEVHGKEKTSKYFGVSYTQKYATWRAYRRSKNEKALFCNGSYKNEKTAAHASDILAKQLIAKGEKGHKLNFPDGDTELESGEYQKRKRKRPDLRNSQSNKSYQN